MQKPLSVNFSEITNIALVRKSLEGDKNALNQLIKIQEPFIYNVAWKYTNNPEEAKNLTQEVLIRVVTKLCYFQRGTVLSKHGCIELWLTNFYKPKEDQWKIDGKALMFFPLN